MKKRNEIKRFFGLCPQGDMLGLCKIGNNSTCVAPQNDRFCHSELVSESIQ